MSFPLPAQLLPHRAPQLHVVAVRSVAEDHLSIETLARIDAADFPGHFPGRPILPGVAMIELVAQSLGCLASIAGQPGLWMLTGVEKARIRGVVELPAELVVSVRVTDRRFGLTFARGTVRLGAKVVCTVAVQVFLAPLAS